MSEDLKLLFDQYKAVNPAITEEIFQNSLDSFGEQYITDVTEAVKKKDPTSGNPNLTTSTPQTDLPTLPNIIPENEFTVPLGSEQDLSSASSDTTVEMPSTDLPSTDVASSGTESSQTNQPLSGITTPTLDNAGNIPMPTNPIQNPMVKNMGAQLNVNNRNLANIDAFYEANKTKFAQNGKRATLTFEGTNENPIDILGGKNNDIQGEITMTPSSPEALAADTLKREQEAQAEISNQENQSNAFINQYVNKDYIRTKLDEFNPEKPKWINKNAVDLDSETYVNQILEQERRGEVKVARNAEGQLIDKNSKPITDNSNILWQPQGEYINTYNASVRNFNYQVGEQNIDKARFNQGNIGNNPEQDAFGEFMSKASKFGVIPTTEEYESLTTEAARNEYLASLEATQNAQKNKTTFQEEYDKVIGNYNLTEETKFANGFDAVNLLNQGIENGNDKDKAEIDYFTKFFGDRNNVMDFGEYWEREGKAKYKSSLVRENQANYQQTRADIWNDYLSYKNDKLGVNNRFLEEAVVTSSAKADEYALAGNTVALEQERAKMENLYSQYEANEAKMYEISEIFKESNKNFTSVAKKRKEQEEFEIKVQNGEVGANVKNILGQIPLALGTSINSTLAGIGRIVSSVIPSDNLKDALDVMSDTELKVGNIKVASLTDKIKTFKGSDGFDYKEINGKTYGVKADGTIFKTNYQQNGSETNVKEEIDYNGSGMVFLTAKMISDITLTSGVGKGLNTFIGSSANRIANSNKVAQVFGEGSHLAKTSASFAKLAKNADNVSVTGWYVQMYNDSYKMAEQGGITDPVNKHLYAVAMSFTQSIIQRINPDTNFLKPLNTNVRQIARALINENPANAKQAVIKFLKETGDASVQYAKKAGNNVPKEVLEEVIQQGTQDVSNLALNGLTSTNFQTSSAQDYEELVVGTIVPSAVASLLGGKGSRLATINNKEIDLTTYSRNELITELARDPKGLDLIKDFKEGAFFQSQKDSAQKIEDEINTRKKYIPKVPEAEKYTSSSLSDVAPILQKIDEKKELLKKDDGTFAERINKDIADLTAQANAILDNDLKPNTENAETAQPTPQPETVQEQTDTADTEPEQTAVQQPKPIAPIEPSGGAGATAESGVADLPHLTQVDNKGREFKYRSNTKEKDGVTTTSFEFNRSDKDSTQWNSASIPLSEIQYDIADDYKEGMEDATDIKVKELRVNKNGEVAGTLTYILNESKIVGEFKLKKKPITNGQTTTEIESTASQAEENGQTSQAEGRDTTNQLPEMGEGNPEPEEPTQEVTPQEEVNEYDIDLDAIFAQLEENEKAQTNNPGTDGNPESGIDSVQQQGQAQTVAETTNNSGSESDAEVTVQQTTPFSDNEQGETLNNPKTNKAIRDFENGNASGTGAIDFQSTEKTFTPIPQSTYDKLVKRLLGVFKKFGGKVITTKEEVDAKLKEFGYKGTDLQNITPIKSRQLEIINRTNPAPNNYNTWVRNEDDILTAEEAFQTAFEDGEMYPDFTVEDMQQALDSGFVTIYSSKPIEDGNFVTPSKMNAQEYAGGKNGKLYSQRVKISDIAWIDESEGQYARIEFMKTKDGEIYGAKFPDGTIYLNPEKVNANTPIHEFSHLWQQLMPARFKKGVELLKNTPIGKKTFAELKENKGYEGKTDDELWNEALVTVMGNEGERIFNSPRTSKFKEWLVDLFKKLGDVFGIRDLSPNDKLSTFVKGALSEVMGTKEIIPESSVEQKEVPIYIKKMSNTDLRTMLDKLGLVTDAVCPS